MNQIKEIYELFQDYKKWYTEIYIPEAEEQYFDEGDYEEYGWSDPFAKLVPLPDKEIKKIENELGGISETHHSILTEIGAGKLLYSMEEEVLEFVLLNYDNMMKAKKDCLSWIGAEALEFTKSRQKVDITKMYPFLVGAYWNTWFLLANQEPGDDRIYIFGHDWEQRNDCDLLDGPKNFSEIFKNLFDSAKNKEIY